MIHRLQVLLQKEVPRNEKRKVKMKKNRRKRQRRVRKKKKIVTNMERILSKSIQHSITIRVCPIK